MSRRRRRPKLARLFWLTSNLLSAVCDCCAFAQPQAGPLWPYWVPTVHDIARLHLRWIAAVSAPMTTARTSDGIATVGPVELLHAVRTNPAHTSVGYGDDEGAHPVAHHQLEVACCIDKTNPCPPPASQISRSLRTPVFRSYPLRKPVRLV